MERSIRTRMGALRTDSGVVDTIGAPIPRVEVGVGT